MIGYYSMFLSFFRHLFYSKNPDVYWFQTLVFVTIVMLVVLWWKRQNLAPFYEGFTQDAPFVSMFGKDQVFDDFYLQIYDRLFLPDKMAPYLVDHAIQVTQADKKNAVFLDIGSGTGHIVGHLEEQGYTVYGIEDSAKTIEYASAKYPDAEIKCGGVQESMTFDPKTITHALCFGMTLYEYADKGALFRNVYHWLIPGGYFIVQLVDPAKFDTIVPGGRPPLVKFPQEYAKKRITDTIIDFIDYEYRGSWQMSEGQEAVFRETFTDGLTRNVRQNERIFHMAPIVDIVRQIQGVGFVLQGSATIADAPIPDKHQYVYIFKKTAEVLGYKPIL